MRSGAFTGSGRRRSRDCARRLPRPGTPSATESTVIDEVGEQLAGWGKVLRVETRGRATGAAVVVAVGFIDEPDGSVLVAAGSPDADWARNLEADPRCRVSAGDDAWAAMAEPLAGPDAGRAVRLLILRYGTPAERLGAGPVFRLRRAGP